MAALEIDHNNGQQMRLKVVVSISSLTPWTDKNEVSKVEPLKVLSVELSSARVFIRREYSGQKRKQSLGN